MKQVLTLMFSLVAIVTFGQSITGQVISEDGITLPGAIVKVADTDLGAVTDADGEYRISRVPAGSQTVTVDYIGYQTVSKEVNVDASGVILNFTLTAGIDLDEVVVVGQNLQGISRALNQQKNNDNITNVVSADQVGKFPDANIGDAMKRIPGITMQNDQGEARNIYIRGIAPQYNSVTLNGDRIPSAEGDNRNVQMDLIPADMIQLVEVNKAVLPEMDADAIGGSVNLVTRTATDKARVSVTFAPGYSPIRDKTNWTGAVIASDRYLDNKLGVVFSGTYDRRDYGSDNFEAEYNEDDNGKAYIEDFQIRKYDVARKRLSGSIGLDYKFNANHKIEFKTLVSDRKDWENRFRLRYKGINENGRAKEIRRETKGGIGSDKIKNKRLEHQKMNDFKLKGEHIFGRGVELDWNTSYSDASENRPNERYLVFRKKKVETNITGFDTENVFVTPKTALAAEDFEYKEMTEEFKDTKEKNYKGKFKVKIPVLEGVNKSNIKFGYAYKNKSKNRDNRFTEYDAEDAFPTLASANATTQNLNTSDLEKYKPGQFASNETLGKIKTANLEGELIGVEYIPVNYDAEENVNAAFIQYKQHIGEQVSIIAGARYEGTTLNYNGNSFQEGSENFTKTTGESDYSNFLPSIHFNYRPETNTVIRAAWTNTMARPNYYDLVPYVSINEDGDEVEVGNPALNAAKSMNLDVIGEKYFESIGVVSLGGFYKNIDDFFYTYSQSDFSGLGLSNADYSQPRNGESANVYGVEVAVQRQLDFVSVLRNFNIYANYTYTGSEATVATRNEKLDLPGTAPHMLNASLSYENKSFNSRLSYNYTSDYVDEYGKSKFFDSYYDKQSFLDFNANYFIGDNWTVFGEAKNLTNQPLRYYQGVSNRTKQMEYYRPNYNLGVKYNF